MTLIDRLSKLEGPDRGMDAEIALQNGWRVFPGDNWIGPEGKIVVPEYTRSVDAAIALAERVQSYSIMVLFNDAFIWLHARYPSEKHSKMLPIAFLIAILRAKEASEL